MSQRSNTSRNLTDNLLNPPNFPKIVQELAVALQSSEALLTDNQGFFGPFQPLSLVNLNYLFNHLIPRAKFQCFSIERSMRPPSPFALRPDDSNPIADSSIREETHFISDRDCLRAITKQKPVSQTKTPSNVLLILNNESDTGRAIDSQLNGRSNP